MFGLFGVTICQLFFSERMDKLLNRFVINLFVFVYSMDRKHVLVLLEFLVHIGN